MAITFDHDDRVDGATLNESGHHALGDNVQLKTKRLHLRDFVVDDWPAFHAVESRPEVAQYQHFAPRTPAESRAYVQRAIAGASESPRQSFDLATILTAENRLIGCCVLGITTPDIGEATLSYSLHPDCWGQGYMTEAARAMVDFGFRVLRLHRIWADCDPANVGSWRVLEKIGMRREGHLVENAWIKGEWVDSLIYAVLAREWA